MISIITISTLMFFKNFLKISIFFLNFLILFIFLKFSCNFSIFPLNSDMFMDSYSFPLIILSLFCSSLILISSSSFLNKFLIYFILTFLILTFISSNILYFYIFFEMVLIPTLLIISKSGKTLERNQAGIYLILYTISGSLPLLTLICLYFQNLSFISIPISFYEIPFPLFLCLAFLIKFPLFFFHLWLPKAHVEAPMEGSMILAGILLKLGGYGIIRFSPFIFFLSKFLSSIFISCSLLGACITSMICIRQKDFKSLIAYSSVAHMALVISSILSFKLQGINGAMLMMISHGLCSSSLFLLVSILYNNSHSRNILLFKSMIIIIPNSSFWWLLFSSVNFSIPPSLSLLSEIIMFSSIIQWNLSSLFPLMFISFLVSSFSILLFANLNHNQNLYSFFISPMSKKFHLIFFSHLFPLFSLSLKPELFLTS